MAKHTAVPGANGYTQPAETLGRAPCSDPRWPARAGRTKVLFAKRWAGTFARPIYDGRSSLRGHHV